MMTKMILLFLPVRSVSPETYQRVRGHGLVVGGGRARAFETRSIGRELGGPSTGDLRGNGAGYPQSPGKQARGKRLDQPSSPWVVCFASALHVSSDRLVEPGGRAGTRRMRGFAGCKAGSFRLFFSIGKPAAGTGCKKARWTDARGVPSVPEALLRSPNSAKCLIFPDTGQTFPSPAPKRSLAGTHP